jgi:hypothetical protein
MAISWFAPPVLQVQPRNCTRIASSSSITRLRASVRRSLALDSHQFIEEFLVVVADTEDVLLILFGQGAAVL